MNHLKDIFTVSERRAARVVGVSRSTLRYSVRIPEDEPRLLARMEALVRKHPRYGYRHIWALLRREGWKVNRKRIYRLWKQEGYRVPQTQHKRRRLGSSENSCFRLRPAYPNHIWAWDFIFDRDERGRSLKWLTVIDEFTRECLVLLPERHLTSLDVIDELIRLMNQKGVPAHIRSDNGPEFIAKALRNWLKRAEIGTLYVEPGAPWENGYAESFQARLRDELLNAESFADLQEARALARLWKREYNEERPHSSLGYLTPTEFAAGQPDLPLGATPLAPGQAPSAHEQRTLIATGTQSGGRPAAITGGVTGAATTVGVVAAIPSGAATLALFVGSIGAEMLTLAGIQMRLVLDMATVYDLQLDTEDPEDVLMIFGYALGIAPTQAVASGLSKAVPVATAHSVRKYVSKGTLDAVQKFGQRIGTRILQKTIIKYAIPVVSAGIGSTYNYVTTKSVGEIAKRHLKNRGKVTDELRALISRRNAYDLVFPAAVMYMANADGCLGGKEKELYRAMLSRMSFEDHTPQEFDRLVRDKDCILDAIGQIEDPETLEALVEMLILMAIYDGAVVPEERDWLLCVADRARVPIDMVAVESRAKEYEVVVKETMVTKATELAGDAAAATRGKLKTLFVRVQARPERPPSTADVD